MDCSQSTPTANILNHNDSWSTMAGMSVSFLGWVGWKAGKGKSYFVRLLGVPPRCWHPGPTLVG
jgi:hypothetical protein